MFEPLTSRRYLIPFKAGRMPQMVTDVLVIGGGVAGLRAAIAAAENGAEVILLAKESIEQSNTWWAQGGVPCIRGLRIPVATIVGMVAEVMVQTRLWLNHINFLDGRRLS